VYKTSNRKKDSRGDLITSLSSKASQTVLEMISHQYILSNKST
jgi:hypothetical protein